MTLMVEGLSVEGTPESGSSTSTNKAEGRPALRGDSLGRSVLVPVVMSVVAALVGALVGGAIAFSAVRSRAADESSAATRSARSTAYADYLASAAAAEESIRELLVCLPPGYYAQTPAANAWSLVATGPAGAGRTQYGFAIARPNADVGKDCSADLTSYAQTRVRAETSYDEFVQWSSDEALPKGQVLYDVFPILTCYGGACRADVVVSVDAVQELVQTGRIADVTVPSGAYSKSGLPADASYEMSMTYAENPLRTEALLYEVARQEFLVASCGDLAPDLRTCR
jgi:hypothetical protein